MKGLVPGHAGGRVGRVPGVRTGHPSLEFGELGLDPLHFMAGGAQDIPDDRRLGDVRDLRKVSEAEFQLRNEIADLRLGLLGEELEERALPRAVRSDEGHLLARLGDEVRVLEDERAAPGLAEVAGDQNRGHDTPR